MDFSSIGIILIGSTFGLILRLLIQNNFEINTGFYIQNISIVNFIASFFLGILVALNNNLNIYFFLFFSSFLACFSTFSSFIYQLFVLFKKGKFIYLFLLYFEVIIIAFICFYFGYYLMQIIQ